MIKRCMGLAALLGMLIGAAQGEVAQAQLKPLSFGALQEMGALQSGHFNGGKEEIDNEWVDHFGAFMSQSGDINKNLSFNVGIGGIFQFQKPENITPTWGGSQYKDFYIGPTVANFVWKIGRSENPWLSTEFGLFNYKYSESHNLGEYLFRSGPYPTFLWTGGYVLLNNASANLHGFRFNTETIPHLSIDLFLTTETFIPPFYDFSVAGIAKYKIGNGLLDITGGFQLKRILPIHDYRTTVKSTSNAYFTEGGVTYSGSTDYYLSQQEFWKKKNVAAIAIGDSGLANLARTNITQLQSSINLVTARKSDTASIKPDFQYYTTAGTLLMGAVRFDPKKLITSDIFGPEDLKLYTEVAVLGWKNYPVFYENRMERSPFMIGFNFPAFKLLDLLSVELEYFNSPWPNSYGTLGASNAATPVIPSGQLDWVSGSGYNDVSKKDNVSWSFLAKKKIAHSITISGQVARDHVRMPSFSSWFGPALDPNEDLSTSKDWYWMIQFAIGI